MARAVVVLIALLGVSGATTAVLLASGDGGRLNELSSLLVVSAYTAVALVISFARPGHRVGRVMLAGAAVWGVGEGLLAGAVRAQDHGHVEAAGWLAVVGGLRGLGWLLLVLVLPLLFPDGRTPWGGRRPMLLAVSVIGLFGMASVLAPRPLDYRLDMLDSPTGLPTGLSAVADSLALGALALAVAALVVAIAGIVHRWRAGGPLVRQQLLWFAVASSGPLVLMPLMPAGFVEPWLFGVLTAPIPVAVAVAVFQHRLYDVTLVVNRTATFVALSTAVACLYAAMVIGAGWLLRERGAAWLPWVAAGVVALAFAPMRDAMQRGVNRLTYGQWSQPADILASTGRRLGDAADVPGLLRTLTAELGPVLALDYVEIADDHGRPLAVHGSPSPAYDQVPLTAYGRTVGSLRWSAPHLRPTDRRVLDDLAGQLGGLVHSARLVDDLRDAQEELVLAREEERRRLRRDLHDGLGPALAGLTLQTDTVRNLIATGRAGMADEALLRLRDGVAATVLDVRRIVEGLRPPALDELGLDGALVHLAERVTNGTGLAVHLRMPEQLPSIPAALEVAAYRVTQEALSNTVRHSGATTSHVVLSVEPEGIRLKVTDDGCGDVRPRKGGIGLTTMHERAAEIGGRLVIRAAATGGTTVDLWLPRPDGVAP